MLHLPDSHRSARLSHPPHRHTARLRRRSCRRHLHHTLLHLRTTRRPHPICTFRRPVLRTHRRHPATPLLPPITAHLRLISLGARFLQVLVYLQPALSIVRAVPTSLRLALSTKELSPLQNTLPHLLRTLLLVLNSLQPPREATEIDDETRFLLDLYNNPASTKRKKKICISALGFHACLGFPACAYKDLIFQHGAFPSPFFSLALGGTASMCQQNESGEKEKSWWGFRFRCVNGGAACVFFRSFYFRVCPTRLIVLGLDRKAAREKLEAVVYPTVYECMNDDPQCWG